MRFGNYVDLFESCAEVVMEKLGDMMNVEVVINRLKEKYDPDIQERLLNLYQLGKSQNIDGFQ